jgi:hypothetical protein
MTYLAHIYLIRYSVCVLKMRHCLIVGVELEDKGGHFIAIKSSLFVVG